MNEKEIAALFVRAAETERKLPTPPGLKQDWGGYTLPWVHTVADINSRMRAGLGNDSLRDGDDPIREWRTSWLEEAAKALRPEQISDWEACLGLANMALDKPQDRRALWAWAFAQAGGLTISRPGRKPKTISFARWCREVEHVSEMTGHRRKNRALASISAQLGGKAHLHDANGQNTLLPCEPENRQVWATVEGRHAVYDTQPVHKLSWRDDPAFKAGGLTLADKRAEDRRAREALKRRAMKRAA